MVKAEDKLVSAAVTICSFTIRISPISTSFKRLDEANNTQWEVYDSAVDESTSTDDEDCHA